MDTPNLHSNNTIGQYANINKWYSETNKAQDNYI